MSFLSLQRLNTDWRRRIYLAEPGKRGLPTRAVLSLSAITDLSHTTARCSHEMIELNVLFQNFIRNIDEKEEYNNKETYLH